VLLVAPSMLAARKLAHCLHAHVMFAQGSTSAFGRPVDMESGGRLLETSEFGLLNRDERHDFVVNRSRTGEILELDQKSMSNFLSFSDH
jgi:hypothetical protein